MKRKTSKLILFILVIIGLSGCKTYTIPVESFKNQFADISMEDFKKVYIDGAIYGYYMANPIDKIQCFDKSGNPFELTISPAIEIRFTYGKKQKKASFYFDTVILSDGIVKGQMSRLIPSLTKEIPVDSITKIEVMNDGKINRYVNK